MLYATSKSQLRGGKVFNTMEQEGWILLHRKILEWEWWDDHNTFIVFIYLLLKANHKEKSWRGIPIERGQHITSYEKLAKGTGLSIQSVRTSTNKLISTEELTSELPKL